MNPAFYDTVANTVANSYSYHLSHLAGIFSAAITQPGGPLIVAADAKARMHGSARRIASLIDTSIGPILGAGVDAAKAAVGQAGSLPLELREFLDQERRSFVEQVERAAALDSAAVLRCITEITLRRRTGAQTVGIKPRFLLTDAAGRSRDSVSYLAVLARGLAVRHCLETFVYCGVQQGRTRFVATYPADPSHRHNGVRFAPKRQEGVIDYDAALAEVFHPNTGAVPSLEGAL